MLQMNIEGNKIKENKYKILRMSLLLGNGEDREETVTNFEDAAREIDAMNDEVYLRDLDSKLYDTFKLEDEEKKLSELVDYIGGRVEQRMSLVDDFANVAGYELTNLPIIKYQDRLDEYKARLRYIKEYLGNVERIKKLNEEVSSLENKLNDGYVKKAKAEEKNKKSEDDLFNRYKAVVSHLELFQGVTEENIDSKLNDVVLATEESKKSLDIFNKSFSTLNQAGISGEERNEYLSYVEGAREVYYKCKEKEYLLRIYSLLSVKEEDYNDVIAKREKLNAYIAERLSLREELNISDNDVLSSLYDFINKQYAEVNDERTNIDNIDNYIREIDSRKMEISSLERDNQKVEILSLLKEYCIIDTYDEEKEIENVPTERVEEPIVKNDSDDIFANVSLNNSSDEKEEKVEEEKTEEVSDVSSEDDSSLDTEDAKDNQVISIDNAASMNIASATSKSNGVMKRVGEMLGVKIEVSESDKVEEEKTEDYSSSDAVEGLPNDIFDNNSYDADPEEEEEASDSLSMNENPLFNNELSNSTLDEVMANNDIDASSVDDDFWSSNEEKPLDLSSLPDLSSENNDFFSQNGMPSLEFPDLNSGGLNNEEGK